VPVTTAAAVAPVASPDGPPHRFERHRPEDTTLHRVVRENLQTLYAALEEQGTQLPAFVRDALDGYLSCGVLCRGFSLWRCDDCRESQLVAFSCKSRAFCPSCLGRRMAQTATNLAEHVLPTGVPLRQWVITFPFSLRSRLAYDGELLGAVGHLFSDTLLGFYRRRMALEGVARGQSGVINVVQRVASDLKLAPHFHAISLDGVYAETAGGELVFHALPRLRTDEVADVLQTARIRITGLFERRGLLERDGDEQLALRTDDALSDSEPALARLAQTAVGTQPPAGPELRRRIAEVSLPGRPGFTVSGSLCVAEHGFSLHAATRAGAHDEAARERLLRYVLRPPLATERLRILPDELVRLELKKPFGDGTWAIDLDPLSLLWRLCAAVPPPRRHTVVYSGVLSSHSKWRSRIVPAPAAEPTSAALDTTPASASDPPTVEADASPKPRPRCRRRSRAELLRRSFGHDPMLCPHCGGKLRLHAVVQDPASIRRILRHRGEPTEPPPLSPARGPPFWKSTVLRRKADAQAERYDEQRDLFHT
jgi:hypothetical protein